MDHITKKNDWWIDNKKNPRKSSHYRSDSHHIFKENKSYIFWVWPLHKLSPKNEWFNWFANYCSMKDFIYLIMLPNYVNELQSVTSKTIGQTMEIGSILKAFSGTPVLSKLCLLQYSDHVPNLLSHLVTPITKYNKLNRTWKC